jgi:hypothetical protein
VPRFILIALFSASLWGQSSTTGNLQGIVVDSTGSPMASASVTLRSLSSGAVRTLQSQEDGRFSITSLPIGSYSLRVEQQSFNPVTVEPLDISVGQTVTQRIVMNIGTLTQKLDVQEQADALQTTAITENVTFGGDRIEEAPAQNRNYLNFVLVAPGVAASQGANTSRSAAGIRNSANDSGLVFNGMRGRNNSISIDGVDNRDETTGGNRVAVGLEMVQEFRVAGTSVDAEFGGAAGGLVNMVTHTGQNVWHGDFTLFHQNQYLNARSAEAEVPGRPYARRWQPGTSTGGPIRRDKTFFFTSIEQSWESVDEWSDAPRSATLINAALQSPSFARSPVSSVSRGLFNSGEGDTEFSFKATHYLTPGQSLTARYAFSRGRARQDVQSGDNFLDQSARGSSRVIDHSLVAGWSAGFSPNLVNDLRMQYGQRDADITPNTIGPEYDIPGVLTLGQSGSLDQARTERHIELVESLQNARGRHLLSFGASAHSVLFDGRLANRYRGVYVFPTLADFILGRPDVFLQAFGDPRTSITTVPLGFWAQDRWQLAPGLSLNIGVRYDRQSLPREFPVSNRNVAPRVGIAWQPGGRSGWVFRAGAGLFYDRYPLEFLNYGLQKNGLQGFEQYLTGGDAQLAFTLAMGGTLVQPLVSRPRQTYTAVAPFPSTYSRKVVLGAERRIDKDTTATIEYSDVHGLHLPRIRSNYPNGYWLEQSASSTYKGVSLTVNHRFNKEIAYLASYNYSVTHDDASDYDEQPLDPRNTQLDWALSRQHQPHRLSFSGVFDLFDKGWFKNVTLAPVFVWGSGRPLNTLLTSDVYRTGAYPISARPLGFPRNIAWMPRTVSLDARLMKTIKVKHERALFQFGVEAFNLMNHTNRLRVSPYYTASFGGLIEAQIPRQVQLMAQLEY